MLDFAWETQCLATVYQTGVFPFISQTYLHVSWATFAYTRNLMYWNIYFSIFINYLLPILAYESKNKGGVTHGRQQPKLPNRAFFSRNLTNVRQTVQFPRRETSPIIIYIWIYMYIYVYIYISCGTNWYSRHKSVPTWWLLVRSSSKRPPCWPDDWWLILMIGDWYCWHCTCFHDEKSPIFPVYCVQAQCLFVFKNEYYRYISLNLSGLLWVLIFIFSILFVLCTSVLSVHDKSEMALSKDHI